MNHTATVRHIVPSITSKHFNSNFSAQWWLSPSGTRLNQGMSACCKKLEINFAQFGTLFWHFSGMNCIWTICLSLRVGVKSVQILALVEFTDTWIFNLSESIVATAARYSEHRGSRLHEKHGDFIHFEIEPPAIKFYIVLYVSIHILVFIANCVWLYRFFPRFVGG